MQRKNSREGNEQPCWTVMLLNPGISLSGSTYGLEGKEGVDKVLHNMAKDFYDGSI
jgi:hypothetical protein